MLQFLLYTKLSLSSYRINFNIFFFFSFNYFNTFMNRERKTKIIDDASTLYTSKFFALDRSMYKKQLTAKTNF